MGVYLLQDHRQREEQSAPEHLLREELDRIIICLEGLAHHLSLALHYFVKHFIHLSKRRLESINDTLDLPCVVFVHVSRRRLSKGVPVIPAVLEL